MYQPSVHWCHLYILFLGDLGRADIFYIWLHNLYVKNDRLKISVVLSLFLCSCSPVQGNLILFPCTYRFSSLPRVLSTGLLLFMFAFVLRSPREGIALYSVILLFQYFSAENEVRECLQNSSRM